MPITQARRTQDTVVAQQLARVLRRLDEVCPVSPSSFADGDGGFYEAGGNRTDMMKATLGPIPMPTGVESRL